MLQWLQLLQVKMKILCICKEYTCNAPKTAKNAHHVKIVAFCPAFSSGGVLQVELCAKMRPGMRAVVQRVSRAEVRVEGQVVARIGTGLLVLAGFAMDDTPESGRTLAEKIVNLRVFENEQGRMDRSILEAGGEVLCVSQFTLYGDCRKGRRPSYTRASSPEAARPLYEAFLETLSALLSASNLSLSAGRFQAMMEVESVNDGPVTLLLDSEKLI